MPIKIDIRLLEAYSRTEMTRREIEDRLGKALGFGTLLGQLHEHRLPLPRVPTDPNAPGVRLIKQLAERTGPYVG